MRRRRGAAPSPLRAPHSRRGARALGRLALDQHHYLGLRSSFCKTLRYVAVAVAVEGWLALLGWQAAALKCAARDAWIGWAPVMRYQRLHLLVNNARFLILLDGHMFNLASRVLALNLRHFAGDWQCIHGHPLLLAETFVDTTRFTADCYRAANRQALGSTRGFARHNGRSSGSISLPPGSTSSATTPATTDPRR